MPTVIGKTSQRIDDLLSDLVVGLSIANSDNPSESKRLLIHFRDGTISEVGLPAGMGEAELEAAIAALQQTAEARIDQAVEDINEAVVEGQEAARIAAEILMAQEIETIEIKLGQVDTNLKAQLNV